jgi:hypothetical protein
MKETSEYVMMNEGKLAPVSGEQPAAAGQNRDVE